MDDAFYTLAAWHVLPGEEDRFIEAWKEMGDVFAAVPDNPQVTGTLLRRSDEPNVFVSFGPWPTRDAIERMRADPQVQEAMARVKACCTHADPATYERVTKAVPSARSGNGPRH